ncbi:MAG TPA: branched-chain amino acid ABC transporter permease [Tepidisphaeraceae bacterium]|nr:branched-chain amino acid ABC transporter permease [Tepidisphaeraceae bacterium]
MSKKSEISSIDYSSPGGNVPPPGKPPRSWWAGTLAGNGRIVAVIAVAAWLGYMMEGPDSWAGAQSRMFMLMAIGVIMAVSLQLINGVCGQFSLGHAGFMAVGAYISGYASLTYNALDPGDLSTRYQNVAQVALYLVTLALVVTLVGAILGAVFLAIRQSRHLWRNLPPILMLVILAWFTWDFSAAFDFEKAPSYFIWTNIIRGLGTLFHAMLDHGMPHARAISLLLPVVIRRPLCFIVLLIGGGSFAAAAGLLVGLPTLRLRGDYLAIATLGFAQILIVIFTNSTPLGGATGLSVAPFANSANPDRDPVAHYIFPWIMALMVITIVAVWRIAYSPKGRMIRAVSEDEVAASAVGISTTRQKVTAFVVGAFFAGVGGTLYVHSEGYVNAEQSFGINQSLLYVVMVTLGGLGSISGAIVAGAILTMLPFLFRQLASDQQIPSWLQNVFEHQLALFALVLIVMMLLRPRGLLGGRELWWRRRNRNLQAAPAAGATV